MGAAAISHGALVDGTDAFRLVLPLAAVVGSVANFVHPDAEAAAAVKETLGRVTIRNFAMFCLLFGKRMETLLVDQTHQKEKKTSARVLAVT